jgi:hypothetical protein
VNLNLDAIILLLFVLMMTLVPLKLVNEHVAVSP